MVNLRILVLSNMYPSNEDQSFGVFVKNFYDYLSNINGFDNTSLIAIKGKPKSKIEKLMKYASFYFEATCRLILKEYDLVYVHFVTYPAVPLRFASLFKNIPMAFNIHGSDWITHSVFAERLKRLALPLILKAKLVVVPSTVFKDIVKKELPELDENRIKVSYSGGINLELFKPNVQKSHFTSVLVLGYVSRIIEKKGWRLFVEVVRMLKAKGIRVKGIMAGSGEQEQELFRLMSSYNLNDDIDYKGAVAQEGLPELYNQMDLFIFPTLFYESLGLVGLEAMACGTPIVGSNLGGIKEYVKHGLNGFLFEPGNVMDLCAQIESYILLDEEKQNTIKENALQTAQSFDRFVVMDELIGEIYKCVS